MSARSTSRILCIEHYFWNDPSPRSILSISSSRFRFCLRDCSASRWGFSLFSFLLDSSAASFCRESSMRPLSTAARDFSLFCRTVQKSFRASELHQIFKPLHVLFSALPTLLLYVQSALLGGVRNLNAT